jgi:ribonuclease BN (tRNA processing enzyme)
MHKFSLKCFGVGDGWPCDDRYHSSFLYRLGKVHVLFDCGEPLSRTFKASGLSYESIDRIFISHLHFDHIGGFFMFVQGLWLEQRQKDLPVHLPAHARVPVRQMLDAGCIFDELLSFRLQFEPLRAGQAVVTHNVRVTPFPSTHLGRLQASFEKKYPGVFEAFCFLIESGGLRIGHSADLGAPEDLAPLLEKPLDLLVCELAHFNAEKLFAYVARREIKRLLLIHLNRKRWENLEETRALAARWLGNIPVSFAQDLDEITLDEEH